MVVQKDVHKQTQNHQECEEHASTHDMNKKSNKVHLCARDFRVSIH